MITIEVQDLFENDRAVIFKSDFSASQKITKRNHPQFLQLYYKHLAELTADIFMSLYKQRYEAYKRTPVFPNREAIGNILNNTKQRITTLSEAKDFKGYYHSLDLAFQCIEHLTPSKESRFHDAYAFKIKKIKQFMTDDNMCQIRSIECDNYREIIPV